MLFNNLDFFYKILDVSAKNSTQSPKPHQYHKIHYNKFRVVNQYTNDYQIIIKFYLFYYYEYIEPHEINCQNLDYFSKHDQHL